MKNNIREILDKTNINVLDEINIIEYIDELEQIKEEYIKSLDKLDVLEDRIDKAIELLEIYALYNSDGYSGFYKIKEGIQSKHINYEDFKKHIEDILRGEDENNSI